LEYKLVRALSEHSQLPHQTNVVANTEVFFSKTPDFDDRRQLDRPQRDLCAFPKQQRQTFCRVLGVLGSLRSIFFRFFFQISSEHQVKLVTALAVVT
jgi:hypothetical protein